MSDRSDEPEMERQRIEDEHETEAERRRVEDEEESDDLMRRDHEDYWDYMDGHGLRARPRYRPPHIRDLDQGYPGWDVARQPAAGQARVRPAQLLPRCRISAGSADLCRGG